MFRAAISRRMWLGWLCLLALLLPVLGCSFLPDWLDGAEPTRPASGEVLFYDDFSNPPGKWGVSQSPDFAAAYERGGLRLLVVTPGKSAWSVAGQRFADAAVSADAERITGPENNMIGLICRYQDKSNFYLGLVSSDGYYGIARIEEDRFTLISADLLQYNADLIGRNGPWQLTLVCSGSNLILAEGRVILAQASDPAYSEGDVGVFAGAYDEPGVDVLFDEFTVRQP